MSRLTFAKFASALTLAGGALSACYNKNDATPGGTSGGASRTTNVPGEPVPSNCAVSSAPRLSNLDVMTRLAPSCKDCHAAGASKPYFESIGAFEQQIAYSSKWVKKGDPAGSPFLALMKGQGAGSYRQMPLSGATYEELAKSGAGKISMAELEEWITALPQPGMAGPTVPPSGLNRLSAEQILSQMDVALGITKDELLDGKTRQPKVAKALPVQSPDEVNANNAAYYDPTFSEVTPRFVSLGGPSWLSGGRRTEVLGPSAIQTVIQVSQARCRYAVEQKKPNVFRDATPADTSAAAAPKIRKNIGQLYLRITGQVPKDADIDALYNKIFLPLEKTSNEAAWTGVCASLMRHPLALSL
jgi:hypothetical protein